MTNHPSRKKISATQIVAGALSAGSAALAARYLGLVGTVIGASIVSAIATIATAIYEHSISRTNAVLLKAAQRSARRIEGLVATVPVLSPTSKALVRLTSPEVKPETKLRSGTRLAAGENRRAAANILSSGTSMFDQASAVPRRRGLSTVARWKLVTGMTAAVLITSMATVTGLKLADGGSLSELLHGSRDEAGHGRDRVTIEQPVIVQHNDPTVRITVTPSPTATGPTPTPSATPTGPSQSPSESPTTPTTSPTQSSALIPPVS